MNFLEKMSSNAEVEISSLEIAELTGKQHGHVMRDIKNEIASLGEISQSIFGESTYTSPRGKEYPCFTMNKKGAMQLALKYDAVTRFKVIEYVEQLEKKQQSYLPTDYISALKALVEVAEEYEKVEKELEIAKPRAEYADKVLDSEGLLTSGDISKDFGMSAQAMNKILHENGVIYKQSKTWYVYSKYEHLNLMKLTTYQPDSSNYAPKMSKWTHQGYKFVVEFLQGLGYKLTNEEA